MKEIKPRDVLHKDTSQRIIDQHHQLHQCITTTTTIIIIIIIINIS